MQLLTDQNEAYKVIYSARSSQRLVLVPTMGNLHTGHLQLIEHAKSLGDQVIVTIFVNDLQFDHMQDLANYPRTLQTDLSALEDKQVDYVFAPTNHAMYPESPDLHSIVHVPHLTTLHCGASRPGHFDGVATIVSKLFNILPAHIAVFGEKDYQQLLVIKKLVRDLAIPIEIYSHPIVRAADGLALSSRNSLLTPTQRQQSAELYQVLRQMALSIQQGESDFNRLIHWAKETLHNHTLTVDYISICHPQDLSKAQPDAQTLVILAAVYVGEIRLIDNILVNR